FSSTVFSLAHLDHAGLNLSTFLFWFDGFCWSLMISCIFLMSNVWVCIFFHGVFNLYIINKTDKIDWWRPETTVVAPMPNSNIQFTQHSFWQKTKPASGLFSNTKGIQLNHQNARNLIDLLFPNENNTVYYNRGTYNEYTVMLKPQN